MRGLPNPDMYGKSGTWVVPTLIVHPPGGGRLTILNDQYSFYGVAKYSGGQKFGTRFVGHNVLINSFSANCTASN